MTHTISLDLAYPPEPPAPMTLEQEMTARGFVKHSIPRPTTTLSTPYGAPECSPSPSASSASTASPLSPVASSRTAAPVAERGANPTLSTPYGVNACDTFSRECSPSAIISTGAGSSAPSSLVSGASSYPSSVANPTVSAADVAANAGEYISEFGIHYRSDGNGTILIVRDDGSTHPWSGAPDPHDPNFGYADTKFRLLPTPPSPAKEEVIDANANYALVVEQPAPIPAHVAAKFPKPAPLPQVTVAPEWTKWARLCGPDHSDDYEIRSLSGKYWWDFTEDEPRWKDDVCEYGFSSKADILANPPTCPPPDWKEPTPSPTEPASGEGEQIARLFHDTYERLAPQYGYETRKETRAFDPASPNGRLMISVCSEVTSSLRSHLSTALAERDAARAELENHKTRLASAIRDGNDTANERNALRAELAGVRERYAGLMEAAQLARHGKPGWSFALDRAVDALASLPTATAKGGSGK